MTICGSIHGVILNDSAERARLVPEFENKPYGTPPLAPVVYMKPRGCITQGPVRTAAGTELDAAATVALLLARDACAVSPEEALATVGAACLALDLSFPQSNYYRPAAAQRNGDGFLPLARFGAPAIPPEIVTRVDGTVAHRWSLDRLVRPVALLIADLSAFMTLRAGDLLLVGLPGDAPRVRAGQSISVQSAGLAPLNVQIEEELA